MTAPTPGQTGLDPVKVFAALGIPMRWQLIRLLADGRTLSANDAADTLHRPVDGVIKSLHLLRDVGLLHSKPKEQDRRVTLYYIPEAWRTEPDLLDFGFCILDLSALK